MKPRTKIGIGISVAVTLVLFYVVYDQFTVTTVECMPPSEKVSEKCIMPSFELLLDDPIHPNDPLFVSVEKMGYYMCDSWRAKITDTFDDSIVWEKEYQNKSCNTISPLSQKKFQYKISDKTNPITLDKVGRYLFQIDMEGKVLEKEFLVLETFPGISLDRTVYPKTETKSIITINERIPQRTIVPISVTQMTKHVEPLDTVTYWGFTILGIEMETLGDYWGNLPPKYYTHIITDEDGNEAVDYAKVPGGFLTYKLTLWTYPATCDDGTKIRGEGGYPERIPIKQGISTVFFNHTGVGLYPGDNGNYSLDFVSGFETDIEFPPDATILSQETKQCSLDKQKGNFTDVYYTNAQFRFH